MNVFTLQLDSNILGVYSTKQLALRERNRVLHEVINTYLDTYAFWIAKFGTYGVSPSLSHYVLQQRHKYTITQFEVI
jgi:hypothetical protein